jgi:hypothetical protein
MRRAHVIEQRGWLLCRLTLSMKVNEPSEPPGPSENQLDRILLKMRSVVLSRTSRPKINKFRHACNLLIQENLLLKLPRSAVAMRLQPRRDNSPNRSDRLTQSKLSQPNYRTV